jgi:hypothetical protein
MQRSYLCYKLGLFAFLAFALYSCKKQNGINNNNVIETPYSLYVADSGGVLYNTNDGSLFNIVFPPDGYPQRAICIAGNNLFMAKAHLSYSSNNGVNFNPTYDSLSPAGINQSLMLYSQDENRVYVASIGGRMGIAYSANYGLPDTWVNDTTYDSSMQNAISVSSFTEMTNNVIVAYDALNNRVFSRNNSTDKWVERTNSTSGLPAAAYFTLGHYNNTLVAIDNSGQQGAWYSNDTGKTWAQYTGLPNRPLLSVSSPFNQVLLVGTDSAGVYRLQGNTTTFQSANSGLANNTSVKGITYKTNLYKNSNTQNYVYIATNQGLYRSVDNGSNWILTFNGNFVDVY